MTITSPRTRRATSTFASPEPDAAHWSRPHRGSSEVTAPHGLQPLIADWVRTCELGSTLRGELTSWGDRYPVLAGLHHPSDVLDRIDESREDRLDELLWSLIALFQDGHELAGRAVLQAMLPAISSLGRTRLKGSASADDPYTRLQAALAEFWTVLAAYPLHRTRRITANLTMDTVHRVTAESRHRHGLTECSLESLVATNDTQEALALLTAGGATPVAVGALHDTHVADPADPTYAHAAHQIDPAVLNPDCTLVEITSWAAEMGAITTDEAHLVLRVYSPAADESDDPATIAEELGLTRAAVRQRCSRALRRLKDAVHEHLNLAAEHAILSN